MRKFVTVGRRPEWIFIIWEVIFEFPFPDNFSFAVNFPKNVFVDAAIFVITVGYAAFSPAPLLWMG